MKFEFTITTLGGNKVQYQLRAVDFFSASSAMHRLANELTLKVKDLAEVK